jgi:predicted metal-dependent HD superfamily phosphohydrolase
MKSAAVGATRFDALWRRCVASPPSPDSATVYAELRRLLGAPNRHFHNLDHVLDCLGRSDEVASLLVDRDAVELALWFHDAVYELGAATNEQRSAELFLAQSAGARPVFRRRVCGLILATRHAGAVRGNDRRFIVDIDLSGFGGPWEEFMNGGARLRAEFSARSDAEFNAGQTLFLQRLQRRPRFFATDYFRDKYEAVARENLRRVLELNAGQGSASPTS